MNEHEWALLEHIAAGANHAEEHLHEACRAQRNEMLSYWEENRYNGNRHNPAWGNTIRYWWDLIRREAESDYHSKRLVERARQEIRAIVQFVGGMPKAQKDACVSRLIRPREILDDTARTAFAGQLHEIISQIKTSIRLNLSFDI